MLCHCFWHGLFCFPAKPYLSMAHWEMETRSCLWPAATKEVPYPWCHQWPLLHHYFAPFLGSWNRFLRSVTVLSESIIANQSLKCSALLVTFWLSTTLQIACNPACWWEICIQHAHFWGQKPPSLAVCHFIDKKGNKSVSLRPQLLFSRP
jgi:hypothetical protein